mmetsp:Transcript_23334/g.43439  ORF Transcript_23334/g.43439 Transcript_23334/m.43439 type:complete len:336 (+) Transcript_23334:89-1096(+)
MRACHGGWRASALYQLVLVLVVGAGAMRGVAADHQYTQQELQNLRGKRCTNLPEVQAGVDFTNTEVDPYPKLWYDTKIDYSVQCYVVYPLGGSKTSYELKSMTESQIEAYAPGRYHLTHSGKCGVCSQLEDLVVYLEKRDLTNPVRSCGFRVFPGLIKNCLRDLGFTEECSMIWFHNMQNTKKLARQGGCFGVCLAHVFSANNDPSGWYNPCQPPSDWSSEAVAVGTETNQLTPQIVPRRELSLPMTSGSLCKNCCYPQVAEEEGGMCKNTINGRPACGPLQWQNGPYRLNPCLQCDECRSGPIFQKIAGRTRRGSGIKSAIERPGVVEIIHNYG